MVDAWDVIEKALLFIITVLSIVTAVANWKYSSSITSPFAGGPLKNFDYAPRVLLGISSLLAAAGSLFLRITKETDSKVRVGRICLLMSYSALVACTAMLDPVVADAISSTGTSALVVKAVAIACMALAAVHFFFQPISIAYKPKT